MDTATILVIPSGTFRLLAGTCKKRARITATVAGREARMLAAYNAGPSRAAEWNRVEGGAPPLNEQEFIARIDIAFHPRLCHFNSRIVIASQDRQRENPTGERPNSAALLEVAGEGDLELERHFRVLCVSLCEFVEIVLHEKRRFDPPERQRRTGRTELESK